jgi:hypothetical protein
MAFWADVGTADEPKRVYRWLMYMGNVPSWMVKKVAKPSFEVTTAEHKYLNHTFYYPGRVQYETVDITLVDPVNPDAAGTMMQILRHSGYSPPAEDHVNTISKKNATNALGEVRVVQLGAGDVGNPTDLTIVEEFTFINAWVSKVNFGELDYESDNLIDVTLTLRYDYVELDLGATERAVEGIGS